jgi:hypothetical protein
MIAISSSTSQTAITLAQALAKLADDEAAKASTKIAADQASVTQFENSRKPSSQNTAFDIRFRRRLEAP